MKVFEIRDNPLAVNIVDDTVNNNSTTSNPLLHELQLGEQLNECVHQSRRSDFSLMLAMLCDDVREQSQFILPHSSPIDGTSTDKEIANNQILRKHFDLPEKAPLALKNMQQINRYNQGQLVADKDLASLHLANALSPNPIAFRDDKQHIASNILSNTQLICQEKHAQGKENEVLNKPLNMNIDGWLKAVKNSIVESSLIDVAA